MRTKSHFNFLILWGQLTVGGFKIQMVNENLTAIINQTIMLECSFTIVASLESIVVTWQRAMTNEVVHSYYYGKDQFSKQSPRYSGRTSLFSEEFKNGNASLRLANVSPEDNGTYQCYVSGNDKGIISVILAAYYNEPTLIIKQKLLSTILTFESCGYPKADISWYGGDNLDASSLSKSSYNQTADGLYTVRSTMEINVTERNLTYTFVLRNAAVNQIISRTLTLLIREDSSLESDVSHDYYKVIIIFVLVPTFNLITLTIMLQKLKWFKLKKIEHIIPGTS
ncbi:CD276 antigen-like isoform X2 [Carcharodon carcharias]|uniref:CD276 antigen-like isoform X2 n=1 Tax=Carcharodon carcharias TaxID=13397 RepID=UPI001B7D99B1|nr:CD276 antigen-like isoform X2 [Carcharodon carcharias]